MNNNITTALSTEIEQTELEPATAKQLDEVFSPFLKQVGDWEEKAKAIVVTDASQVEEMLRAREARLILRDIRLKTDKARVRMKRDSLRKTQVIDSVARIIQSTIEPLETHLQEQEDFVKIQEDNRKAALKLARLEVLVEYGADESEYPPLEDMSEEDFAKVEKSLKKAKDDAVIAEKAAAAKVKADALAAKKLTAENKKLAAAAEKSETRAAKAEEKVEKVEAKVEKVTAKLEEKTAEGAKVAADVLDRVAEDEAAKANKEYIAWLGSNGATLSDIVAGSFYVTRTGDTFTLYKHVDDFTIRL